MKFNNYRGYQGVGPVDPRLQAQQVMLALGPGGGDAPHNPQIQQQGAPHGALPALPAGMADSQSPGLSEASRSAQRARELADLLQSGAMSRNATSIGTGLSKLGEAFIAKRARRKSDDAEARLAELTDALTQSAMDGDMGALAQLDLGAALSQRNRDQAIDREDRIRSEDIARDDARYSDELEYRNSRDAIEDSRYADGIAYRDSRDALEDNRYESEMAEDTRRYNQDFGLRSQEVNAALAEAEAEAQAESAQQSALSPSLQGLPNAAVTAVIKNDLDAMSAADDAATRSASMTDLAREFMGEVGELDENGNWKQTWGGLGGGFFADVAQAGSQKTARLKGITERQIKKLRTPGEGPMTDKDAERAEKSVNNINMGLDGNASFLAVAEAVDRNDMAHAQWLRDAQAELGYGSGKQAASLWQAYSRANPVFDEQTGEPITDRVPITTWLDSMRQLEEIEAEAARRSGGN